MILKAILLGLVAMLGHTNFLFGTNLLDRPLIMCTLTGLVMGDLKSGIIIGAMMELAFIGAFSVGASLPPDMISGGVLGAALTLAAGNDPEVALTIGVPIASLALLMKNACKIFSLFVEVGGTDQLIGLIQKFVSPILFSAYLDMLKATVLIQRHGSVIKKIGVGYQIHPAVSKQATHMLLQFLAIHK